MTISTSVGLQTAIASAYGVTKNMTAISNAVAAVATLEASHGVVVGDYVEVTSGWDLLSLRIARVSVVATNDVTLEGINTSSTTDYPAGSGTGTVRKISTWTPITQIQGVTPSGGALEYIDTTTVSDRTKKQQPSTRTPVEIKLTTFDDPTLAWYATANSVSESNALAGLRFSFPNGSKLVANGYWSLQTTPNIASGAALTADLDFSAAARPVRYNT